MQNPPRNWEKGSLTPIWIAAAAFSFILPLGAALLARPQESNLHGMGALLDGSGFVRIAAGEFVMGSRNGKPDEQPVHRVVISSSFEMGKFEVTQAQWEAVMRRAHAKVGPGEAAGSGNPSHFKGPSLPVENVSWNEVQQFLRLLNARDPKHEYRLPTEAEWEYACRAGNTGDYGGSLDAIAWYESNSDGRTQPVGRKDPNAWGLYDMHGNVWEWVQDWYGFEYYEERTSTDPAGPESGSYKVYRGGGWLSNAGDCRASARGFNFPGDRYYYVGFRLVRTNRK
jgi:formylglycine-generating enzyme required for sulfatase activity